MLITTHTTPKTQTKKILKMFGYPLFNSQLRSILMYVKCHWVVGAFPCNITVCNTTRSRSLKRNCANVPRKRGLSEAHVWIFPLISASQIFPSHDSGIIWNSCLPILLQFYILYYCQMAIVLQIKSRW